MKDKRSRIFSGGILFLAVILFIVFSAYAETPKTINYQGYLTDAGGNPVNGTRSIVFSIYNVNSGGTALWSETQSVAVNNGIYSVILGSVTPINLPFATPELIVRILFFSGLGLVNITFLPSNNIRFK